MKTSPSLVALVAGLYLGSMGFTNAADSQNVAVSDSVHAMHHAAKDPVDRTQKRLDNLSKKLNLTSAQQPAWTTYSSAMLKLAQARAGEMESWRSADRSQQSEISTPERLERMATRMRTGADRLSKLADDTKTFYAQLSLEQKTIFDLFAANQMRNRMQIMHHMNR